MGLVDELARLEEMRARGSLSEDDFQRAKQRLLGSQAAPAAGTPPGVAAVNAFRRSSTDKNVIMLDADTVGTSKGLISEAAIRAMYQYYREQMGF